MRLLTNQVELNPESNYEMFDLLDQNSRQNIGSSLLNPDIQFRRIPNVQSDLTVEQALGEADNMKEDVMQFFTNTFKQDSFDRK
jgi:hypothetical protein